MSSQEENVEQDEKEVKDADITEKGCTDSGIKSGATCDLENMECTSVVLSKDEDMLCKKCSNVYKEK